MARQNRCGLGETALVASTAPVQASSVSSDRAVGTFALGESDARLAFALKTGGLGYWELNLQTRQLFASETCKANFGRAGANFSYDLLLQAIHPEDRAKQEQAVARALADRETMDVEYRTVWPDGSIHWIRIRGEAVYDGAGRPNRMAGVSFDVTDRKQIEESLREEKRTLELLNRAGATLAGALDLQHIVQAVTDAATEVSGAQFGAFFYNVLDDDGESYTLYTLSGAPHEAFANFPKPRNTALFEPTFRGTGVIRSADIRRDPRHGKNAPHYGMPKGHLPVVSYLAVPVVSRSGTVLGGLFFGHEKPGIFSARTEGVITGIAAQAAIAIDNARLFQAVQAELAERRRFERQQDLLLAELNHRVKNSLAIVLAIASQTLRHADSAEAFRAGFEARIMALAQAHDLLTDSNWQGASLRDILQRVLGPYRGEGEPRYTLAGEQDIRIGPRAAVALVMALHELATNAAKYGALSNTQGRVNVAWSIANGQAPASLRLQWREIGGPVVKPPDRQGFGSRLIRGLSQDASAQADLTFEPTGLVCTIELPLPTGTES